LAKLAPRRIRVHLVKNILPELVFHASPPPIKRTFSTSSSQTQRYHKPSPSPVVMSRPPKLQSYRHAILLEPTDSIFDSTSSTDEGIRGGRKFRNEIGGVWETKEVGEQPTTSATTTQHSHYMALLLLVLHPCHRV
jgi:hypothetical protein